MTLALMRATDEDALVCDLAETYGIYDWRSFPVTLVATLATGLREDARINLKLSGQPFPLNLTLLASAVDRLGLLWWSKTEDGQKNKNRPPSILERMIPQPQNDNAMTIEEFDEWRKKFIRE